MSLNQIFASPLLLVILSPWEETRRCYPMFEPDEIKNRLEREFAGAIVQVEDLT